MHCVLFILKKGLQSVQKVCIIIFVVEREISQSTKHNGRLAQLGEHLPYKQGVTGSIPVTSIGRMVQLVRTFACHAKDHGFESRCDRIIKYYVSILGVQFNGRTTVSKTVGGGSIPSTPAMAVVVKWLTHRFVVPTCVGSIPIYRPDVMFNKLPLWRNRQTRWTQNPVPARECGFDPHRRHFKMKRPETGFLF